jgi:hypothetical protein
MRHLLLSLILVNLASPAPAAQLATGSAPDIPWLRLIAALVLSTAVAAAAIIALRRRPGQAAEGPLAKFLGGIRSASPRRIVILETRRASQHGDLCLVEVDETVYLLALTASGATLLDRQKLPGDAPPEAAE